MRGYLDQQGTYYEGDRQGTDREVPQRPSQHHVWDGAAWAENPAAAAADRRADILARLAVIDTESIRPYREISAALADGGAGPAFAIEKLAALEREATSLRIELRGLAV